ncbi:HEAT repeat domain-containing protein [Rhodocytophaga aerolata]|uniref:HEAT repeat domain-containing protein n=1 Tax=Rhodocytophaga aerolata TaxID=455078 RepID=A0ABT8R8R2_9BACT|nr:HEAT repeat domain-containing protein [Rhodocytophaga aerolata]MDO1447653.1 HEAT repeat domain-containing protein [Rhodocytophaga aerolata]
MKMIDIEALVEKYDAGETTLEEEDQLAKYFSQEKVPAHLEVYAAQFRMFAQKKEESASEQEDIAHFLAKVEATKAVAAPVKQPFQVWVQWGMRIAAGISLVLLGFVAGKWYEQTNLADDAGISTVTTASTNELKLMKQVLMTSQDESSSASDRIQAVNQVQQLEQADKELVQLLINTMNFDPNINVRIAASEALFQFNDDPMVRLALVNSLKIQKDPAIQLTLIDMLIQLKETRAVDTMRKLLQSEEVLDVVKTKAEQGIGTLS